MMSVGRFIKRLISPEIDQTEDQAVARGNATGDGLRTARENYDDRDRRIQAIEEELRKAEIDAVELTCPHNLYHSLC